MAKRRRRRSFLEVFSAMSTGKKIGVGIGGAVVGVAVVGAAAVALKLSKVQTKDIPEKEIIVNEIDEEKLEGYTNIALFGGDSRQGSLEEGTHSDCIIVASVNNETKEVRMVSVYRDSFLDQTDGVLKKANNAYFVGGPKQAINMLNMNLDLDIKDYVTVDFGAVADAVDLLGGIEIDIKDVEVQYMNKFIDETARFSNKKAHHITKSGLQLLDGAQATTYARIRSTAGSDFTRTERQRLVIEKMAEKAKSADLGTLNKIIDKMLDQVSTSFSAMELMGLAKDAMKYSIGKTEGFPFEKTTATLGRKGSVVIPTTLEENVIKLHEFLFDEMNYQPSATVKKISNAIQVESGYKSADPDSNTGLDNLPSTGKTYNNSDGSQGSSGSYSGSGSKKWSGSSQKGNGTSKGNSQGVDLTTPKPDDKVNQDKTPDSNKKPDNNQDNKKPSTSTGDNNKPSTGDSNKPSTGDNNKPSTGDNNKPSTGDNNKPGTGNNTGEGSTTKPGEGSGGSSSGEDNKQ